MPGDYLWGEKKVPMRIDTDGAVLTLRWGGSASGVTLTPVSGSEFLDRTSFGRIRFTAAGAVWIQEGRETAAPRAPSSHGG